MVSQFGWGEMTGTELSAICRHRAHDADSPRTTGTDSREAPELARRKRGIIDKDPERVYPCKYDRLSNVA